jgi:broad specificity phosphatase PhoE
MGAVDAPSGAAAPPIEAAVAKSGSEAPLKPSRSASRRAARSRVGMITLARHGEPDISRKVKLNAAEYAAWWARYEETGLLVGQTVPGSLRAATRGAGMILCSTRPRAIESATAAAEGRDIEVDAQFIEAPLPPPNWPNWLRLAPRSWGFISRFWWWWFNHHDGQETRAAAQVRADAAADRLIGLASTGRDVVLIAHGFFNTMVGQALKKRGWSLVENEGFKYWSSRRFARRKG